MTPEQTELASLLLAWSASLDDERVTFEEWQDRRREENDCAEFLAA